MLLLFSAIFAYALKLNGPMNSSGVKFAAGHAMVVELTYLSSLGLSIIAYRVSPWHPLAKYPGPVLARVTKWWMAYWIANGTRHLMLQRCEDFTCAITTWWPILFIDFTRNMALGLESVRACVNRCLHTQYLRESRSK